MNTTGAGLWLLRKASVNDGSTLDHKQKGQELAWIQAIQHHYEFYTCKEIIGWEGYCNEAV